MAHLLCNRWLLWSFFVAALVALGVGIYRSAPPQPMCAIEDANVGPRQFIDEERKLVTFPIQGVETVKQVSLTENNERIHTEVKVDVQTGPLQVWDVRTGTELARHVTDGQKLLGRTFSKDGRYLAAEVRTTDAPEEPGAIQVKSLLLIDLANGTSRDLPLESAALDGTLHFGPDNKFLVRFSETAKTLRIYDVATGHLLAQRKSVGLLSPVTFDADILVHLIPGPEDKRNLEIWSLRENKVLATLEDVRYCFSPAGRFLLAERSGKVKKYTVWDLRSNRLAGEFLPDNEEERHTHSVSNDGRWLAAFCQGKQGPYLELRELQTGRQVATAAAKPSFECWSPDGRFFLVFDDEHLSMFEAPTLKTLWKQRGRVAHSSGLDLFSSDSQRVLVISADQPEAYLEDIATGARLARIAFHRRDPFLPNLQLTPDRRFLLVHDTNKEIEREKPFWESWLRQLPGMDSSKHKNDTLLVFDMNACREHFRLMGWKMSYALLSDDGHTLVTVHDEDDRRVLRCWDMDAWKPLHWAIGVPAVLGTLFGLCAIWRVRRTVAPKRGDPPCPS